MTAIVYKTVEEKKEARRKMIQMKEELDRKIQKMLEQWQVTHA